MTRSAHRLAALTTSIASVLSFHASRGAADEILVADQAMNRIIALDPANGNFLRVVTSTGLDLPSSLSFGPGGFLYATNFGAFGPPEFGSKATVVKINPAITNGPSTDFITSIAGPGAVGYDPVNSPNSLFVSKLAEFSESGAAFTGNEVYKFDAAGTQTQTIGTGSPQTGRSGIVFDAAGNLYVTDFNFFDVGSVLKYSASSNYATGATYASGAGIVVQGPPGAFIPSQAGGFNGLTFDGSGSLYVAALTGTSVIKFSAPSPTVTGQQVDGPIAWPSGLLLDTNGDIIITSLGNNNASDPYYPGNLFPGTLLRYKPSTGAITPFLVGDANRDNKVDGADLTVITAAYGMGAAGDLDGDLDTDGNDVLLWQRNVGHQSATGSFLPTGIVRYAPIMTGVAIPEPGSAALAVGAVLGVCWTSLRPRRR